MNNIFKYEPAPITIFVGAYGSGKSEVSVNFALQLAQKYSESKIYLADLDIINPFYRSADTSEFLAKNNIHLISSLFAGTNVDVPAVPAEVNKSFVDRAAYSVFDIGGEDMGARIVGSLKSKLEQSQYELLMVVNPYRPFTDSPDKIARMASQLSAACSLPLDGLVANPNLLVPDDGSLLQESFELIQKASHLSSLPLKFAALMLTDDLRPHGINSGDSSTSAVQVDSASSADKAKTSKTTAPGEQVDNRKLLSPKIAANFKLPILQLQKTIYYPSDDVASGELI